MPNKDKNQRDLKLLCQINNVPPEASFKYDVLNGVEKKYYIVMQSAFEGYFGHQRVHDLPREKI